MKTLACTSALGLLFVLTISSRADQSKEIDAKKGAPQNVVYDAPAAFAYLATMVGDWERSGDAEHEHGDASRLVNFKTTAAGSSVMETIHPGDPHEMLSIYHMDGDNLLLTHYCALQNAPIMKFEKSDKPGEIKFVFHGGTNFDPKSDTHVHEGVFRIKDANTVESSFTTFTNGKADAHPSGVLKRKKSK